MKNLLLFLSIFSFTIGFAQDWAPFKTSDTLRHFISAIGTIHSPEYQIQTIIQDDSSSSTNFHLKTLKKGFSQMPFNRSHFEQIIKGQILGDTARIYSDSSIFTSSDQFGYRLFFPHNYSINQQFTIANSSNSNIKATVDSMYVDSINGNNDSLVRMHLTAYNTTNTINTNHDFHLAAVIVSKNNGLIKAVDFTDLTGKSIVDQYFMEKSQFTERDKFELTKGDEYHYKISRTIPSGSQEEHIVRVTSDTLIGNQRRIQLMDDWANISANKTTLHQNSITKTFIDTQYVFNNYSQVIEDTLGLAQSKTITVSKFTICSTCNMNMLYYTESEYDIYSLFSPSDSIIAPSSLQGYIEELKIGIDYEFTQWGNNGNGFDRTTKSIVYIKKGSQTWGTPLSLPVGLDDLNGNTNAFRFYPNPTTGDITIAASKDLKAIQLYNIQGQKVQEVWPRNNQSFQLQIASPSGIYFLRLLMNDGSFQTSKVVKE